MRGVRAECGRKSDSAERAFKSSANCLHLGETSKMDGKMSMRLFAWAGVNTRRDAAVVYALRPCFNRAGPSKGCCAKNAMAECAASILWIFEEPFYTI